MYVDTSTVRRGDKTYTRHLLRTSFRENGVVRHKTLLNLSACSTDEEVEAIRLALKHKAELGSLLAQAESRSVTDVTTKQGQRVGAAWSVLAIARRLGIEDALGTDRSGKLALLQVLARVIGQGSRLSAVRLAQTHSFCEVLGLASLNEDDLYANLAWLSEKQEGIEKKLFAARFPDQIPTLFLYDVTSSYLEGTKNEMGCFGYSRDGKRGKLQIVVGLLMGPDGLPVAVRVFDGNTQDPKTVSEQIRLLAESFGVQSVTLVGDRGMLKGPQIAALPDDFRYITALTKPQIRKLLSHSRLQMELFTDTVCEVEIEGIRHVLRRNPLRATQIAETRASKRRALQEFAAKQTQYLADHPRADAEKALSRVSDRIKRLKADAWLDATAKERTITVTQNEVALAQAALLDGCYVIISDVPASSADAQTLHDRYCDLEDVERSFRTMKTAHLEMRPIYVRKRASTKGHAFVVMLALLIQREFERCWEDLNITVEEGIDELGSLRTIQIQIGTLTLHQVPTPNERAAALLEKASLVLPTTLPLPPARVHTKTKLRSERKSS